MARKRDVMDDGGAYLMRFPVNGRVLEMNIYFYWPEDVRDAIARRPCLKEDYTRLPAPNGMVCFYPDPIATGVLIPNPEYFAKAKKDDEELFAIFDEMDNKQKPKPRRKRSSPAEPKRTPPRSELPPGFASGSSK